MSRKNKFRGWDKELGKYVFIHTIGFGPDGSPMYIMFKDENEVGVSIYRRRAESLILEQYTGLKDKNGKEIAEGDIVRRAGKCFAVVFADGKFMCEGVPQNSLKAIARYAEVIGSIHENPELLEGER